MNGITFIRLELNTLNGLTFEVIDIDFPRFEGSLLGLSFSDRHFTVKALFMWFEIKTPFN